MASNEAHDEIVVEPLPAQIDITEFSVSLPSSIVQGLDEPKISDEIGVLLHGEGLVGTIIYTPNKSANIWMGWGSTTPTSSGSATPTAEHYTRGDFAKEAEVKLGGSKQEISNEIVDQHLNFLDLPLTTDLASLSTHVHHLQ